MNVSAINSVQTPALKSQKKSNSQSVQFTNNLPSFQALRMPHIEARAGLGSSPTRLVRDEIAFRDAVPAPIAAPAETSTPQPVPAWIRELGEREGQG